MDLFRRQKENLLLILAALVLYLARYWDAIFQYKIVGNSNDSVHLIGPVFKKINELMLSGQDPIWIEELLGGIPFYNNAMFSFTYPFYFLGVIDYGDGLGVLRTISLIIVFHMGLLFLSNWILLRVIGFDKVTALLSAFGVILCLNTAFNSPWIIAIGGYALVPLFFAGIISLFKHSSSLPGIIILSIGSLCFLAKPAQTAILAIVFGGILTIVGFWVHRDRIKFLIPRFFLAGLFVLGINLPGLVQLYLDFPEMVRFTAGGGAVQGNTQIPLEAFKSQIDFHEVLDYLIYRTKSIGVGHPWTGPFTLFSLVAFWLIPQPSQKRNWIPITFFWITVVTIIIAFGKELPTFWLHYEAPLLNKIRESSRFLFITNIGLTVLMAYVLSSIKEHWNTDKMFKVTLGMLTFSVIIFVIQCYLDIKSPWIVFLILVAGVGSIATIFKSNSYPGAIALISAILIGYALLLPSLRYGKNKVSGFGNPENLAIHKTFSKFAELSPDRASYRTMYHVDDVRDGELSNAGLYYNIRSFQGTTVVIPANQYKDLWHAEKHLNYRLFWGAKYHLYSADSIPSDRNLTQLFADHKFSIYTHQKALPRAYFTEKVIEFDGNIRQFRKKLERQKSPKRYAYLSSRMITEYPYLSNNRKKPEAKVLNTHYFDNTLTIEVSQNNTALLTINEYYSTNWKATCDDKPIEIHQINVNQMGIITPSGDHEIVVTYSPSLFKRFRLLQKFCFAILIILMCILSLRSFYELTNNK